jgi:hypothetical protein
MDLAFGWQWKEKLGEQAGEERIKDFYSKEEIELGSIDLEILDL